MSPIQAAPVIITPPPVPPPADPDSNAPPTLTVTYYQQLAAHLLSAFDEIAAILPQFEETGMVQRTGVATKPPNGHHNIPIAFLRTAVDSTEQLPELQVNKKLDVERGRDTLQLLDAFRTVQNRAAAFGRGLGLVLDTRQSALALQSLDTYSLGQSLARDKTNVPLNEAVDNMQRTLGRRGRRKKKDTEPESTLVATPEWPLTARMPEVGQG
jgi:hypothetical protein